MRHNSSSEMKDDYFGSQDADERQMAGAISFSSSAGPAANQHPATVYFPPIGGSLHVAATTATAKMGDEVACLFKELVGSGTPLCLQLTAK